METVLTLTRIDLTRPIAEIFNQARAAQGGEGWPRLVYKDEHDAFAMRLTCSVGHSGAPRYEVSCMLNNSTSYQLNNRSFSGAEPIGRPMLIASSAPAGTGIKDFFA